MWPHILVALKSYGNNKSIFTFLQTPYKSPCIPNPYSKLTRGTMWEWFTKDGVLKENYIQATECRTIVKNPKQNMTKLEEHPKLRGQ